MKFKTTECSLSDLKPDIASFVHNQLLLEEDTPLFCYATEFLKTGRIHVVVVTKSEIIRLSKRDSEEIMDLKTMYLDKVVMVSEGDGMDGEKEIKIFGHSEYSLVSFPFDSKEKLFAFLYQLRQAIFTAKSRSVGRHGQE